MSTSNEIAAPAVPCWLCGDAPTSGSGYLGVELTCRDCYDGAPDSVTRSFFAEGTSLADAIVVWNEMAANEIEMAPAADRLRERVVAKRPIMVNRLPRTRKRVQELLPPGPAASPLSSESPQNGPGADPQGPTDNLVDLQRCVTDANTARWALVDVATWLPDGDSDGRVVMAMASELATILDRLRERRRVAIGKRSWRGIAPKPLATQQRHECEHCGLETRSEDLATVGDGLVCPECRGA